MIGGCPGVVPAVLPPIDHDAVFRAPLSLSESAGSVLHPDRALLHGVPDERADLEAGPQCRPAADGHLQHRARAGARPGVHGAAAPCQGHVPGAGAREPQLLAGDAGRVRGAGAAADARLAAAREPAANAGAAAVPDEFVDERRLAQVPHRRPGRDRADLPDRSGRGGDAVPGDHPAQLPAAVSGRRRHRPFGGGVRAGAPECVPVHARLFARPAAGQAVRTHALAAARHAGARVLQHGRHDPGLAIRTQRMDHRRRLVAAVVCPCDGQRWRRAWLLYKLVAPRPADRAEPQA